MNTRTVALELIYLCGTVDMIRICKTCTYYVAAMLSYSVQVAGLAFLHYLVMLGSTVMLASTIVPAMGGRPVSISICFTFHSI
jgi:hypothetical protein